MQRKLLRASLYPLVVCLMTACSNSPTHEDPLTQESGEGEEGTPPADLPPDGDLCNGVAVDLQTDPDHCGECDNPCWGRTTQEDIEIGGDLLELSCVAGVCQNFWTECYPLQYLEPQGQSCADRCGAAGCSPNGCADQTLVIWRDVEVPVGIPGAACPYSSEVAELQPDYQCEDPLPPNEAAGILADYFSCCCNPE